jgi:hypothetical protein
MHTQCSAASARAEQQDHDGHGRLPKCNGTVRHTESTTAFARLGGNWQKHCNFFAHFFSGIFFSYVEDVSCHATFSSISLVQSILAFVYVVVIIAEDFGASCAPRVESKIYPNYVQPYGEKT